MPGEQRRSQHPHVPLWAHALFRELPLASPHREHRAATGWLWENSGNAVWRRGYSKSIGSWVSWSHSSITFIYYRMNSCILGFFIHHFYFKCPFSLDPEPWEEKITWKTDVCFLPVSNYIHLLACRLYMSYRKALEAKACLYQKSFRLLFSVQSCKTQEKLILRQ